MSEQKRFERRMRALMVVTVLVHVCLAAWVISWGNL